jgi:hypothetical protein
MNELARDHLKENGWKVAAYVKEQNLRGIRPTLFSSQKSVQADAPENSVGIDVAIEMFPKTVAERLDRALLNLASVTTMLSWHPGEKWLWSQKASEHPLCTRKTTGELEIGLANLWRRKRITKKAHAGRGQEPNAKCHLRTGICYACSIHIRQT